MLLAVISRCGVAAACSSAARSATRSFKSIEKITTAATHAKMNKVNILHLYIAACPPYLISTFSILAKPKPIFLKQRGQIG
jgi:hypothetical protein